MFACGLGGICLFEKHKCCAWSWPNQTMSAMTGKMDYQPFCHPFERSFHQPGHKSAFRKHGNHCNRLWFCKFLKFLKSRNNKKAKAEQLWASSNEAALALLFWGKAMRGIFLRGDVCVRSCLVKFQKWVTFPRKLTNIPWKNAGWKTMFPLKGSPFQVTFVHFRGVYS